jgi:hypothetical protein
MAGSEKVFETIGTVAGGLNSAVTAGVAIKNAFNPPKGPARAISLGSSGAPSLGGTQAYNPTQSNYNPQPYAMTAQGGGGGSGGGQGVDAANISRQHYGTLMDILNAYKG